MNILKKVVCFPFVIVLGILRLIATVVVQAECYIAVLGIALIGICMIWCLINHMWQQLGILALMLLMGIVLLVFSASILVVIEDLQEKLAK